MKIKIQKEDLIGLLKKTQNIVENRTSMPVLKNILLSGKQDELQVFATNLEVSLVDYQKVEVLKEGQAVINAKNLFDIVRELKSSEIILEKTENQWLKIKQGKSVFNIVGINPEEYPVFPSFKTQNFVDLDKENFIEMIEKTIFSVSVDEKRFHLNGVYLKQEKNILKMVSTDGHRLSLISRKIKGTLENSDSEEGIIVPRKGLNEIKKLLEVCEGRFQIAIEGAQLIVKIDTTILMIRLIEGKFPNYQSLIPSELEKSASLNKEEFLSSIKRVSLLANQQSKSITLSLFKGKMEISSNNPEMGDAKEEIPIVYSGEDIKIGFNARFIIDVLRNIQEDNISLSLKDKMSPSLVQPEKDKNFTCVIMPMHI